MDEEELMFANDAFSVSVSGENPTGVSLGLIYIFYNTL